jgi:predicted nucleic acid-binding protein
MTNDDSSPIFIDTNVLVDSTVVTSPFHTAARNALQNRYHAGIEMWISRQVLREYLSTLTRPQVYTNPLPIRTLVADVHTFEGDFRMAEDGPDVMHRLLTLIEQHPIGGKQIHDANIVATMQTYGITKLLTRDTAHFERFTQIITIVTII